MKKLIKRICRTLRLTKKDWKSDYMKTERSPITAEYMDWRMENWFVS